MNNFQYTSDIYEYLICIQTIFVSNNYSLLLFKLKCINHNLLNIIYKILNRKQIYVLIVI